MHIRKNTHQAFTAQKLNGNESLAAPSIVNQLLS